MSRIVIVILIYRRHKPIDSINLLDLKRRRNMFPVRYELDLSILYIRKSDFKLPQNNIQVSSSCLALRKP
jgi:hypothetical protein